MNRRHLLQSVAALAAVPMRGALAQSNQVTTVVVGFSAGAAPDIAARYVAHHMSSPLNVRNVIVDNRPGAGGQLAFVALRQASADGSVLAFGPSNLLAINPLIYSKLPYSPSDVVPIVAACTYDFALVVGADHPAKTLMEFVDWCKANPKKASLANPGLGTPQHFFGWMFGRAAGIDIEAVPYRSTPQMAQDVMGGQIAGSIAALPLFIELVRSGKVRLLATAGDTRSTFAPEVSTFAEAGYSTLRSEEWFGLFARSDTPTSICNRVADAVRGIVARSDVAAQFRNQGLNPVVHDANWMTERIRADSERWTEVVRRTGFKADS